MRQFDELTDEEILDLTDEQIERYVDLACAQEGVAFLPPEPVAPEKPAVDPDRAIYVVQGIDFGNKEDAQRVAEVLLDCEVLKRVHIPGAGYKHQTAERVDATEVTVGTARVFTREHWDEVREQVQEYEGAKQAYDREEREYNEAADRRSEISEHVYERVREARKTQYRRQTLRDHFDRYLALADGNESTAAKFLADAHHDARDLLPELYNVPEEIVAAEEVSA